MCVTPFAPGPSFGRNAGRATGGFADGGGGGAFLGGFLGGARGSAGFLAGGARLRSPTSFWSEKLPKAMRFSRIFNGFPLVFSDFS